MGKIKVYIDGNFYMLKMQKRINERMLIKLAHINPEHDYLIAEKYNKNLAPLFKLKESLIIRGNDS